ncbi:hypothetical protein [Streptomyces sp. FIT100]|uniref:hypothetical protein n=1 Tax=Streptomyces sp. FIT100 TaxID=2837956 RepID=UPI0037DA55A0
MPAAPGSSPRPSPAADSHPMIQIRDARENNLADVSLDLPERRLTVLTGVSGSGKSSLVFGTNAAESQHHHQAVMAHADRLIDLGPGGAHDGGRVVFTGAPADLAAGGDTRTARHLREYVTSQGVSPPRGRGRGGARRRAWRR